MSREGMLCNICRIFIVVVNVDGMRLQLWTVATNWRVVHPPDNIWSWRATAKWHWQGKTKELGNKTVSVPLCQTQIPQAFIWAQTPVSAVRSRWLTAWAMARHLYLLCVLRLGTFASCCILNYQRSNILSYTTYKMGLINYLVHVQHVLATTPSSDIIPLQF
jgi:hypothetical protein